MPSFRISMTASVQVSAAATVEAPDQASAVRIAQELQAQGRLRWSYRGAPIGAYSEPVLSASDAWAVPLPDPSTVMALVPSVNVAAAGAPVTVTASLTSAAGIPEGGTVQFFVDEVPLVSIPVTAGSAAAAGVILLPGAHSLTAHYSGYLEEFLACDGGPSGLTVLHAVTTVSVPVAGWTFGDAGPHVATAVVGTPAPPGGAPALSGTMSFTLDGGFPVSVPLVAGQAQFDLDGTGAGAHMLSAHYSGDSFWAPSTSPVTHFSVAPAFSSTTVQSYGAGEFPFPVTNIQFGAQWSVRGTVTAPAGTIPPLTFVDVVATPTAGGAPFFLGTAEVDFATGNWVMYASSGVPLMNLPVAVDPPGTWVLRADWPGTADVLPCFAEQADFNVDPDLAFIDIAPLTGALVGDTVPLSAHVFPSNPVVPLSGTVDFIEASRGILAANVPLVAGVATSSFVSQFGNYSVHASYHGDPNFAVPDNSGIVTRVYI
jgi:hypothetical protein